MRTLVNVESLVMETYLPGRKQKIIHLDYTVKTKFPFIKRMPVVVENRMDSSNLQPFISCTYSVEIKDPNSILVIQIFTTS